MDKHKYNYLQPFLHGPNAIKNLISHPIQLHFQFYESYFWMNECLMLCKDICQINNATKDNFQFADQIFCTVMSFADQIFCTVM